VAVLSLMASYLAVRESHRMKPWGAFWATVFGPLVLLLLLMGGVCIILFVLFPLTSGGTP
jgi:hypothetical protein